MEFRKKTKFFFIRKIFKFLINVIFLFSKFRIEGIEKVEKIKKKNLPIIFVFWHKKIFVTIYQFKNSGARPLISNSTDGELVSQVAEEFRMKPVRGSSSKGGARAFIKMMHSIKKDKSHVLITADGPKGPPEQIKEGTIKLAIKTEAAIIPISWNATKVKIFKKSWDNFEMPLPFGKIVFKFGDPIYIKKTEKELEKNQIKQFKKIIKDGIDNL